MSLQDKIARQLLAQHGPVLDTSTNNGWWTELRDQQDQSESRQLNYERCTVGFGDDLHTIVSCQLANTDELQVIGLSKHASISPDEGMIFPYPTPRKVSFWMSTVSFPLDMIFVGSDGRVTQKIENIEPGDPGRWGMDHVSAVIEVNGGFCASHDIEVGTPVYEVVNTRQAQEHFPSAPRKDIDPKQVPFNPTRERFLDRDLLDQQVKDQPMTPDHEEQYGYDPVSLHDDQENVAPVRMSMVTKLAAVKGLQPAFMNKNTGQIVKSPGIHDMHYIKQEHGDYQRDDWIDGYIDASGKFYTRSEALEAIGGPGRLKYPTITTDKNGPVLHAVDIPGSLQDPESLARQRAEYSIDRGTGEYVLPGDE